VKSLHVENLLTFDTFELRLDGGTHTVVGPNGAGKSNIVRLFDLVGKGVDWASLSARNPAYIQAAQQVLQSFAGAHHHGTSPDRPAIVRLEVEFATPDEREHLATFLRAAILCTLLDETNRDPGIKLALSHWVETEIVDDKLTPLFAGTLVLRHVGMPHLSWDVSYEFTHGGENYSWLLATRGFSQSIVRVASEHAGLSNIAPKQLKECLLGIPSNTPQTNPLPDPLPEFDFGSLCPTDSAGMTAITIRTGTGSFDVELQPFRRASELLGIPSVSTGGQQAFALAHVLSMLLDDGMITLGEQFRGLGIGGTPPQQAGPYSWEALVSPLRSRAPWVLPMRLFELKNGNPSQRAKYQAIQKMFTELAPGRSFDVKFQAIDLEAMSPSILGTGQLALFPPAGSEENSPRSRPGAAVTIVVDRTAKADLHPDDLPIQLHGGGTWEVLVIAEALVEAEGRFVILDEPALTLHPTWQRALRSRIQTAQGTFLVVTHSADLVPMESASQLTQLVRIENESGATQAHRFPNGLPNEDVARVVKEFSLSTDAVSLLFARGVVLLEGETERGTLPKWFASCHATGSDMAPDDLDLAFFSVGGDKNFRTLVSVLQALTIPWVLVCDGAIFDVRKHPHIFEQVLTAHVPIDELKSYLAGLDPDVSKRVMDNAVFDEEKALGRTHGVFTLAEGWTTRAKGTKPGTSPDDESFEAFLERVAPGKLNDAEDAVGDSKVRMGLWIAENVTCPPEVSDLYLQIITVLQQRGLTS
jgi:ABC-type lipoprotein export system ATPase subunit